MSDQTVADSTQKAVTTADVEEAVMASIKTKISNLDKGMDTAVHNVKARFIEGIDRHLKVFVSIIKTFHTEIMIFHRLEVHMRNGTLTDEILKDFFKDLDEHRASVQKAAEATQQQKQ